MKLLFAGIGDTRALRASAVARNALRGSRGLCSERKGRSLDFQGGGVLEDLRMRGSSNSGLPPAAAGDTAPDSRTASALPAAVSAWARRGRPLALEGCVGTGGGVSGFLTSLQSADASPGASPAGWSYGLGVGSQGCCRARWPRRRGAGDRMVKRPSRPALGRRASTGTGCCGGGLPDTVSEAFNVCLVSHFL
jgi:hypothetical protein